MDDYEQILERVQQEAKSREAFRIITHLLENGGEGEISEVSGAREYKIEAGRCPYIEIDTETGYMELNRAKLYKLKP